MKRIEIATTFARGAILNIFDEPEAGIDLWSFSNLFLENFREIPNVNYPAIERTV